MFLGYMATDQYGSTYHIGDNPPRKWLLNYFDRKHARKMYVDRGFRSVHVGYVIAGMWLTIRRVSDWKEDQT